MLSATDHLDWKLPEILFIYIKFGDKTGEAVALCVPVSCDLLGIPKVQHGVKDRLVNKAWRESAIVCLSDKFQLIVTDGAIECDLHGTKLELPKEAEVVFGEEADVVNAVFCHRHSVDAQPPREAGVALGVNALGF